MSCLFCKIINKEAPADILYEDDKLVVFKDIYPDAPVHLLLSAKKHVPSIAHLEDGDRDLVGHMIFAAKRIAQEQGLAGYKLLFNVGREGGQIIDHLHLHLLGGWKK